MQSRIRFPLLILLAVLGCLLAGCGEQPQPSVNLPNDPVNVAGTVQLEVDFRSDRDNIVVEVPCSADSTVFTILEQAQKQGDLNFKAIGKSDPATTFVNSIGGLKNMAGAGDNWTYRVNGVLGDKGSAVFLVKPGDQVNWIFGKYSDSELPDLP